MKIRKVDKINVLFVSPAYKPYMGGTERIIEQLSKKYLQFNNINKVGVLTTFMDFNYMPPKENNSLPAEEIIDGLKIYRVAFSPKNLWIFYCLPAGLFSWKSKKIIEDFQPDVIHFLLTEWFIANVWIYFLTRKKSRHVFTIPFHEMPEKFYFLPMKYFNIFLGRMVNKVQVHSSFIKKRVIEYYHIPEKQIEVIPLGSASSHHKTILEKNRSKNCLLLLTVGRLSIDKGQLELIKIFHKALKGFKKETRLVLVGGDGGKREEIEKYIKHNQLEKCVKLMGFISEDSLHKLYQKADIFILLTRVESFGIVFAEAQSYGLPIIGYRIGPLDAAFKKGAILAEPYNKDKVSEAIQRLVNNDQFREELGREAIEYASKNFSWEKAAQKFMNLYTHILKELA